MVTNKVVPAYADVEMAPPRHVLGDGRGTAKVSDAVTLVERTDALIRGLDLILKHHGAGDVIRVALDNQVHGYLDNAPTEAVWLQRGKFLLAYPFSRYLRNESPEIPDSGTFKPTGCLRQWIKCRLLNYCRKNTHLWFSWLQAKRSALPASEEMININYDKHLKTLTKEDMGEDQTINRIMSDKTFLAHLDQVRAKVQENLLRSKKVFYEETTSLSASFSSARSTNGAFGELIEIVYGRQKCRGLIEYSALHSMTYVPTLIYKSKVRTGIVVETRMVDPDAGNDWSAGLLDSKTQRKKRVLSAKIQGILEPMKVRVISKGPALDYYAMKPLQKALHTAMRNMDCYRLIGRPLFPTDVLDLKEKITGDEEWISVDYSGATDNLSWKYSGAILRYVIQDLPEKDQECALDVLGPHHLYYPNRQGTAYEKEKRGTMRSGQLMGSILSFPILCLSNMGLYLDVTRDYQLGWTPEERLHAVLVNGDDMLYCAPKELFYRHIETGRKVGLEMTVGKAYHHYSYTNVNSTCIDCPLRSIHPYEISFLNTGLFFGQNKVMGKVSLVSEDEDFRAQTEFGEGVPSGIVTVLPKVLAGSLPGRQCSLLKLWFNHHNYSSTGILGQKILADCKVITPKGFHFRNIFLPISMGGMGVDAPNGWKYKVTKLDRKYAEMLWSERTFEFTDTQFPLRGNEPRRVSQALAVPWSNWSKTKTPLSCGVLKNKRPVRAVFSVGRVRMNAVHFAINSGVCILA